MTPEQRFFSIIIPTYNRPDRLSNCLTAISQLDYPRDRFEVVVVDDGSRSSLEPIVAPFQDSLHLTLLRQTNAGPAAARNAGAAHAQGEYLVFTDDDCTPLPNWLQVLEAHFAAHPHSIAGGRALNALPHNLYSTASQVLIDYLYAYYNSDADRSQFFASNNFALSRQLFEGVGKFDTTFPLAAGEDRELCDRLLHHGHGMHYLPAAQINHAHELTLAKFWRQHFNYGRGAYHFHQLRAKRSAAKIRVEPWSFYYQLITYPFSQPSQQPRLLIMVLFILSQLANVCGFFWERQQAGRSPKPALEVNSLNS
jgi:glycosyltransferase involved in cell wall biosynthesis